MRLTERTLYVWFQESGYPGVQFKWSSIVKQRSYMWLQAFLSLLVKASAYAHDPAEHANQEGQPDCSSMGGVDPAQLDMNDPVTQAMMQKCMKHIHGASGLEEDSATTDQQGDDAANRAQPTAEHWHSE
jgi:hypothetical protein